MKMKTFKIGDFITFGGAIVSDVRKVELHETLTASDGRKLDFDGSYYAADVPKPGGGDAVKGMMLGADFYMLLCYENLSGKMEQTTLRRLSDLNDELFDVCEALQAALRSAPAADGGIEAARWYRAEIAARTRQAGELISRLETLMPADVWPFPTYADILFSV